MSNKIQQINYRSSILDFVAVGVCLLQSDWKVLFWNNYLEEWTKISRQNIVGTNLLNHFNQLNQPQYHSYWKQVFEQGEAACFSVPLNELIIPPGSIASNQTYIQHITITPASESIETSLYAVLTLQNLMVSTSGFSSNTTQHLYPKPTKTSTITCETELEDLIYSISHDLQEPLRMVTSFTQLLGQRYSSQLDGRADQIIHFAVDGATRMQQMIDGLLEYSRLKSRQKPVEQVESQVILQRALTHLQPLIQDSHADITVVALPLVTVDDEQLLQLFQILIDNAIKYQDKHPSQIEIGVQPQAQEWLFWVRDNGIGIDVKQKERIFGIFQRLHTRQKYQGIGMGLAIAKRIVELHQGQIWVESVPERGSTFYFTLPRYLEDSTDLDLERD